MVSGAQHSPRAASRSAESFNDLISCPARLRNLLAGSWVTSDTDDAASLFRAWEESRRFIADAITGPGRILDYGCANGFLLRCVLEWSDHQLEPYGVDIESDLVQSARDLFPEYTERFVLASKDSDPRALYRLRFDHVYWAVGDNVDFREPQNVRWFEAILSLVARGGSLILGFYGGRGLNAQKVDALASVGVPIESIRVNASSPSLMLATVGV